jgi:hypothetical protein
MHCMWGTKMEAQISNLLLMRAKLQNEAPVSVSEISSAIRLAKLNDYQKIILTSNAETLDFYGYFYLNTPDVVSPVNPDTFLGELASRFTEVEISRLVIQDAIEGYSKDLSPINRYVVEMDPESGWQEELFSWYDREHLPGLASVPGCIAATRCINLDHSPFSIAFYDLTSPEVLGCEPWLKIRYTTWSDRVRPHFTNVKRTMLNLI